MSAVERYLTLWVALCIVAGIALGHVMPGVFQHIAPHCRVVAHGGLALVVELGHLGHDIAGGRKRLA